VWSFIENGAQTRELCPFYFSAACCPKLILGRVALDDSVITACRNLLLSWFLICWSPKFMGLLNIKKYPVFSLRDHADIWWDRWLLAHWSGDVNDVDHSIFWSVMLHFRVGDLGSPPCLAFSRHGRRRQRIFILAILQFPCSEGLYLACKTF
jgi:hypothetical protein